MSAEPGLFPALVPSSEKRLDMSVEAADTSVRATIRERSRKSDMVPHRELLLLVLLSPALLWGGDSPDLKDILARLDRLEDENRSLRTQVQQLRSEVDSLSGRQAEAQEKEQVQERRTADLAQGKVEATQHFPIRVTGMALFNAFTNSRNAGGTDNPTVSAISPGSSAAGATLRQTVLGLEYQGPATIGGGKVSGSLYMDFFGGTNSPLNNVFRIRTASIQLAWNSTTVMVGQEKPLIAPRDPNSLSQVGISPLTGSGNLWVWEPQVRVEQRFQFAPATALRAQLGVVQTSEGAASVPGEYASTLSRRRPGFEGRFELSHRFDETRRVEIAPGFHFSTTHVAGLSVPSNLFSLDGLVKPWSKIEFTGTFFSGQNLANFGALGQGFTFLNDGEAIPVHARGGWGQISFFATGRLSFNVFGGVHDCRNSDLVAGQIGLNRSIAGNIMYRIAPNVIVSLEALRLSTTYLGSGDRLNNHYDLAVGYLF